MRVLGMIKEVKRYHKRKIKYCIVRGDHILRCEKSMYEPWIMEERGESVCKPVMMGLTEQLIKQNQERSTQIVQTPVVKDSLGEQTPEPLQEKSPHELRSRHQSVVSPTKLSLRSSEPAKVAPLVTEVLVETPVKTEQPVSNEKTVEVPEEKPRESTPSPVVSEPTAPPKPPEVSKKEKSPSKAKQVKKVVEEDEDIWEDNWVSTESSSDFIPEIIESDESSASEIQQSRAVEADEETAIEVPVDGKSQEKTVKKADSKYSRRKEYELQNRRLIQQREEEKNLKRQRAADLRQAREDKRRQMREDQMLLKLEQEISSEIQEETKNVEVSKSPKKTEPSQPEVSVSTESVKREEAPSSTPLEKRIKKLNLWEEARAAYLNDESVIEKSLPLSSQEEDAYWNSKYIQESRFTLRGDKNQSSTVLAVAILIKYDCRNGSSEMY